MMVNGEGPHRELDLRGLKCPLPALKARNALRPMAAGETLLVRATDPMSAIDIPNMVRETSNELVDHSREGDALIFVIRKA